MARRRELPGWLDAAHPTHRTPHRAELTAAVLVSAIVLVADLRGAIGFSSFAVLTYYGLANASAWTLTGGERRWPRWLAGLGVALCALLAVTLPQVAVIGGLPLLTSGSAAWLTTHRLRPGGEMPPSPAAGSGTRMARPATNPTIRPVGSNATAAAGRLPSPSAPSQRRAAAVRGPSPSPGGRPARRRRGEASTGRPRARLSSPCGPTFCDQRRESRRHPNGPPHRSPRQAGGRTLQGSHRPGVWELAT